jgi:hypothetical protein
MCRRPMRRCAAWAKECSACSDAPETGLGRHEARISIRTRTGTHSSLTSSRSRLVRRYRTFYAQAGERNPITIGITAPHSSEIWHYTPYPALHKYRKSGSHLGSTLKPGGAVLTLGVSRRSGSVAYIRVDASPNEVLTQSMMHEHAARVNSPHHKNLLSNTSTLTRRYGSVMIPSRRPTASMNSETMSSTTAPAGCTLFNEPTTWPTK